MTLQILPNEPGRRVVMGHRYLLYLLLLAAVALLYLDRSLEHDGAASPNSASESAPPGAPAPGTLPSR